MCVVSTVLLAIVVSSFYLYGLLCGGNFLNTDAVDFSVTVTKG